MASDGGPMYPSDRGDGASVRDGFAMAIASNDDYLRMLLTTHLEFPKTASRVYDLAQNLTDEKLRRDKADRDEGKCNERP